MRLRDYLHINVWLLPILIVLIPVVLIVFGSSYMTTPNAFYQTTIKEGWSVKHGDFFVGSASLEEINIGNANKGDVVILSHTLPEEQVPQACLMFRTILSVVTVTVDGQEIYKYGDDYYWIEHHFLADCPYIVFSFGDTIETIFDDADPFPYNLTEED